MSGKLPGKTLYSGRRRTVTRRSGFSVHEETTGGDFKVLTQGSTALRAGEHINVSFEIPKHKSGDLVGFGGWFLADPGIEVVAEGMPGRYVQTPPGAPNWSKVGAIWASSDGETIRLRVRFSASKAANLSLYEMACGVVGHRHLDGARPELLRNMFQFAPEANFYTTEGVTTVSGANRKGSDCPLYVKSCNRCGRYLPINTEDERHTLSFSNHCVAEHRRPCSHGSFGNLLNLNSGERLKLEYGFQLECRFCKKFEVNAAHNPKRTAAQMKEDGARRRALELLLADLYGESANLRYRHLTGRELADDVWANFEGKCFNCGTELEAQKGMHLDHTRPLALLWPLDGTATCLCGPCNSEKRDRAPSEFYDADKLKKLAKKTGIALGELRSPSPNMEAVELLQARLDWFFDEFCTRPDLNKERDGKVAAELLVKALQKTLNRCPGGAPFDLKAEYAKRTA